MNHKESNNYRLKSFCTVRAEHPLCGGSRLGPFLLEDGMKRSMHGKRWTRRYRIWSLMKYRCYNTNCKRYKDYGGRGITVCDEWKYKFINFYNWAEINKYKNYLSIDRINNDGNYNPDNCRWTTAKEQSRNSRRLNLITVNGETRCLTDWSERTGINRTTISWRLNRNWDIDKLFSPARKLNRKNKGIV